MGRNDGAVELRQTGAGERALHRDAVAPGAKARGEIELALIAGGERNVATLARHRDPAGGRPDEAGNADAGAGPEHELGAMGGRLAAADLDQILGRKMGQRQRQGLEVVEDVERLKPGRAAKLVAGEGPGGIGEADVIPGHRRGHGEGAVLRRLFQTGNVGGGSAGDGRMVGAEDLADVGELERVERGHGEAGIGAADVGDDGAGSWHGALLR